MNKTLSTIIMAIILIAIVLVLALVIGPCVYYNFIAKPDTGMPDMPKTEEAQYSFYIKNTGRLILANDYEQYGEVVGQRLFILPAFWDLRGKDFKFVESILPLDEHIFGEIEVKRRQK